MVRVRVAFCLVLLGIPAILLMAQAPAGGQQARPQGPPPRPIPLPGKPAEEIYKNIQVLKGVPSEDLIPSMQMFRAALGVQCTFCHKDLNDLADDSKQEKKTAREMIAMMRRINEQNFNGRLEVTCATCHQGHNDPSNIPPVPDADALRARFALLQQQRQQQQAAGGQRPAQPTAAQIFDKFTAAIGGQEAVSKLNTRVVKATTSGLGGQGQSAEMMQKAPNKLLMQQGDGKNGYDGTKGWQQFGPNVQEASPFDTESTRSAALFYRDLDPKQAYPQATTTGRDRVNGHDCWLVRAQVPNSKAQDRLCYDVDSGLLLRRVTTVPTPFGRLTAAADYDDYKEFNGVKVPTTIRRYDLGNIFTTKITEETFNAPVDDSKFAMPPKP